MKQVLISIEVVLKSLGESKFFEVISGILEAYR